MVSRPPLKPAATLPKLQALYKENKSTFTGESSSFLDFVEAVDIGVGPELSLSFLNQYASFNSFVDLATYFKYEPFGKVGVPGSRAILEGLGGASFSLSHAPMRWLSLGVTYSQVYGLYRDIVVTPLNSAEAAQTFDDFSDFGRGQSLNAGLLMISKNYNIDYSLGISARQIGGLVFTDDAHPTYPGTLNVGFGLALHNKGSVIHFSSELEDISAVTSLSLADRLKFGLRFLAWQHLGLALGYSFGQPTAAITLDAILLKLSVSASHRKIGFGGDAFLRPEYTLTTTIGY